MAKLGFKDFLNVDYAPGMPDLIKKNAKKRKGDTGAGSNAEYSSTYPPRKEVTQDPIALGKHAPNIGMGWTGKHRTIKDPGSKTGRHTHVFQYTEQTELDEYNTKSSKAIVIKDNKPIAIYPDLKSAQKDYHGKDGHAIGMRSHTAAQKIKKANPGIKIVESVEEDLDEALTMQQRRQRARIMKRLAPRIKLGRERAKRRIASPEKLERRARRQARMSVFKRLTKDIPKSELTYARRQEIEKRLDKPAVKKRIERIAKRLLPKIRKAEMERRRGTSSND